MLHQHIRLTAWVLTVLATAVWAGEPVPPQPVQPQVGDAGATPTAAAVAAAHPDLIRWAAAGVRGGIPLRSSLPIITEVPAGGDIQAAINAAKADPSAPAVIRLGPGIHPVTATVTLRSGVVLRGAGRGATVLESRMRQAVGPDGKMSPERLVFDGKAIERAGLEDFTLRHADLTGLADIDYTPIGGAGEGKTKGFPACCRLVLSDLADCWFDNLDLVDVGHHTIGLSGNHCTLRRITLHRSLGPIHITGDDFLLVGISMYLTRHSIVISGKAGGSSQGGGNVVLDSTLMGDVIFYAPTDAGHNLFEGCLFYALDGTPWMHPWGWMHGKSGPGSVANRCVGCGKGGFKVMAEPTSLADKTKPEVTVSDGTLYHVDADRPDRLGGLPASDAAARALYAERARKPAPAP